MRDKILPVFSVLFAVLFVTVSWVACESVERKLDATLTRAGFDAGESARIQGEWRTATTNYKGAIKSWQRALQRVGYYPNSGDEYLVAGNCLQRIRRARAAFECYEAGLRADPNSISLLTCMGDCAYSLGEFEKAYDVLQKSRSIYPLKRDIRPLWKKLRQKELRQTGNE